MVDGNPHSRVTSPLSELYSPAYISEEERQFYLNRGSASHDVILLYLLGRMPDKVHVAIIDIVRAFIGWWEKSGATLVAAEMPVASLKYRVAGQIDVVADLPDEQKKVYRTIIDVKTGTGSKPKLATALQTAMYAQAYKETTGYKQHIKRMGVLCRPDGEARPVYYKDRHDLDAYLTLLSAMQVTRRYAG